MSENSFHWYLLIASRRFLLSAMKSTSSTFIKELFTRISSLFIDSCFTLTYHNTHIRSDQINQMRENFTLPTTVLNRASEKIFSYPASSPCTFSSCKSCAFALRRISAYSIID